MNESQNLIAEFVASGSEAAFKELVTRYLGLVHSTALRLVGGDEHLAQDVSQTVFTDLARQARKLPREVMLGGWLHRHTCFVAGHVMRGERRRRFREMQAAELNVLNEQSNMNFSQIAPVLDDAINELNESDRTAILLRFFEQRDFRDIGQTLQSSEDAARMRVGRALEKLELLLKRRGITSTAAALSVALSAEAVHAAPVGMAGIISAAALTGTTLTTTAAVAASNTLAMTTIQKTLIVATIAAVAGTGIFEARQASHLRAEVETLQQQRDPLAAQLELLRRERDDAADQAASPAGEIKRLNRNEGELLKLRDEVGRLRQQNQDLARLRQENQKLKAQLDSDPGTNGVNAADLFILRQTHAGDAMGALLGALKTYETNHDGRLPSSLDQLTTSGALNSR